MLRGTAMIKSELVQRIASQNPHLYQRDIENIVNAMLGEITAALGARRPRRVARLRRVLGQAPPGAHRPQSAHRRACLGRPEVRAVLQDRQGNARAAEQAVSASRRRRSGRDRHGSIVRSEHESPLLDSVDRTWRPRFARPERLRGCRMIRKIVTVLILLPLALLIVMFAVANRAAGDDRARSVRQRAADVHHRGCRCSSCCSLR